MGPGVVPQLVVFIYNALHQLGIVLNLISKDKKGGADLLCAYYVQQLRRMITNRSVVEG